MRFHHILLKYRTIGTILLCLVLAGTLSAQDKAEKKVKMINMNLKVTDENGNPIPKAQVVVGEGLIHAETDEQGLFSFDGYLNDFVAVTAKGYERSSVPIEELQIQPVIKMVKAKLYMTEDDLVPLPFIWPNHNLSFGRRSGDGLCAVPVRRLWEPGVRATG